MNVLNLQSANAPETTTQNHFFEKNRSPSLTNIWELSYGELPYPDLKAELDSFEQSVVRGKKMFHLGVYF